MPCPVSLYALGYTAVPVMRGRYTDGIPGVPWYSVQGNHDIAQTNRQCACTRNPLGCSQIRKHGGIHSGHTWYMPAYNYYVRPLPGVNVEIVNLDVNARPSRLWYHECLPLPCP